VSLFIAMLLTIGLAHLLVRTMLKRIDVWRLFLVVIVTVTFAGLHTFIDRLIFALAKPKKEISGWFNYGVGDMFYMDAWIFMCWVSLFWGLLQYFKSKELVRVAPRVPESVVASPDCPDPGPEDYFWVKHQDRQIRVNADDIEAVEAVRDYVELHTPTKSHFMRGKISEIEQRLDPKQFVRVHRSFIVNLKQVEALKTAESGGRLIVMTSGREVRVGRTFLSNVREKLVS
ncbi:MAG: LytTR family DNA-binding domain-containing protein, partial [Pseudomonadota bacterium]